MKQRSPLLLLFALFLVGMLFANTVFAAGQHANETEDFVDNNTSNVDGVGDKGTHGNFENQKAYDSAFDELVEENTGGAGGSWWNSSFGFRKAISIYNATGAGLNYALRFNVHYGVGVDTLRDLYLSGRGNWNLTDVRFINGTDDTTMLPQWQEPPVLAEADWFVDGLTAQGWRFDIYPQAVYYNQRTYVVFNKGTDLDAYVSYYDHENATWNGPVFVYDGPVEEDNHITSCINVDANGYIHVLGGCHSTVGALYHYRTNNPDDISTWSLLNNLGSGKTYPAIMTNGDTMWLIYRRYIDGNTDELVILNSTNNGVTWNSYQAIINMGSNHQIYHANTIDVVQIGSHWTLHIAWRENPDGAADDLCYNYYNVTDGCMYNVTGSNLGGLVEWAEKEDTVAMYSNYPADQDIGWSAVHLDENNNPFGTLIYEHTGAEANRWWHRIIWWNDTTTQWEGNDIYEVTEGLGDPDYGWTASSDFVLHNSSYIELFLATNGTDSNYGGHIERWKFETTTNTSTYLQTIFNETDALYGIGFGHPKVPVNWTAGRVYEPLDELNCIFTQYNRGNWTFADLHAYAWGYSGFKGLYDRRATYWVRIPADLSATNHTIYIYYGCTTAKLYGAGESVFLLFDDFLGSSINTTKWNVYDAGQVVEDSILKLEGEAILIYSEMQFGPNCAYREYVLSDDFRSDGFLENASSGLPDWAGDLATWGQYGSTRRCDIENEGIPDHIYYGFADNVWGKREIRWTDGLVTVWDGDVYAGYANTSIPDGTPLIPLYFGTSAADPAIKLYIDFCFVYKCILIEPYAGAYGLEEQNIDWENDVDSNTSDVDASDDMGTENGFSNAQGISLDSVNLAITEENLGGAGGSEWLDCNAFDATFTDWDNYIGTTPYVDAQDYASNYIHERQGELIDVGWFDFPATTLTGTLTVNVSIWGFSDDTDDGVLVYVDTSGGSGSNYGTLIFAQGSGSYKTLSLGSFSAAGVNSMRIFLRTTNTVIDDVRVDHIRLGVSKAGGGDDYQLDLEYQWTSAIYDATDEVICFYVSSHTGGTEVLSVYEWTGSTWSWVGNITTTGWQNFSVSYLTGQTYTITLNDTEDGGGDTTQDTWNFDLFLLHTNSSGGGANFELNLEVQFTSVDYDETVEIICIYAGTFNTTEDIKVYVWNSSNSQWYLLFSDLTASSWNNLTVADTITSATVTLRFLGGSESGDAECSAWNIDATLIHSYSWAYTENYYDLMTVDVATEVVAGFVRVWEDFVDFVTPTITLTFSAARTFFDQLDMQSTITTTATLIRAFFELLALASVVVATKAFQRTFFDMVGLGSGVTLTLVASRSLEDVLGLVSAPSLTISYARGLQDLFDFTSQATLTADFSRSYFDALSLASDYSAQAQQQRLLFDVLGLGSAVTLTVGVSRKLHDLLGLWSQNVLTLNLSRSYFDALPFASEITRTLSFSRGLEDVLGLVSGYDLQVQAQKLLFDTLGIDSVITLTATMNRSFYDVLNLVSQLFLTADFSRLFFDTLPFASDKMLQAAQQKLLFDTLGLGSAITLTATMNRSFYDVLNLVSQLFLTADFSRFYFDTLGLASDKMLQAAQQKLLFDTLGLGSAITLVVAASRGFQDLLELTSQASLSASFSRGLGDVLALLDHSVVEQLANFYEEYLYDVLELVSEFSSVGTFSTSLDDVLGLSSIYTLTGAFDRVLQDVLDLASMVGTSRGVLQSLYDTFALGSEVALTITASRLLYDTLGLLAEAATVKTGVFAINLYDLLAFLFNDPFSPYYPEEPTTTIPHGWGPLEPVRISLIYVVAFSVAIILCLIALYAIEEKEKGKKKRKKGKKKKRKKTKTYWLLPEKI